MKISHSFKINTPLNKKAPIAASRNNTLPIGQITSIPAFCGNASQISYSGSALLNQLIEKDYCPPETPEEIQKVNQIASRYTDDDTKSPAAAITDDYDLDNIELSEDEKEFFQNFLKKHGYTYIDEYSKFSDEELLRQSCQKVSDWEKLRQKYLTNIKEAFEEPKNKEIMSEEELDSISSNFFENIAPKLCLQELKDAGHLLYRAGGDAEKLKFDYSILAERRLSALFSHVVPPHPYPTMDLICDFLYCPDYDFEEKIKKLSKRPALRSCTLPGRPKISFENWKTLLNMEDDEYLEKTTPNIKRTPKKTDLNLFKNQIKTCIEKPIEYDNKAVQELIQDFNPQIVTNYYAPKTLYKFEPLAKTEKKEILVLSLLSAKQALFNNEDINFSIPNKGGARPTRDEEPVIHPNDYERLNKTQSARKTIKYGAKINWSNEKIARDILQNFYDGNGHTLEGVEFDFKAQEDGKYTVTIKGLGNYDYEHIENTGSSTKDDDYESAGFYGEGTKILAVNLLSKMDTPFVEYGCGEWKMTLGRSSDNLKEALMTKTLEKNENYVEGNYIKFETKDTGLIESLIEARNYFYHPSNPDFFNFDYENEFFGIKFLEKNEDGNLYLIQRYESSLPLKGVSIVFKKNPNDPYLVEKNYGSQYQITDRDRNALSENDIIQLFSRYIKTMSNEDISKMVCSLEPVWNLDKLKQEGATYFQAKFLDKLLDEMKLRDIGIDFGDKYAVDDKNEVSRDMMHNLGYKIGISKMSKAGMKPYEDVVIKKPKTPNKMQTRKIHILDEGLKVLHDNADIPQMELIKESEIYTPKYIFKDEDCPNTNAQAIIESIFGINNNYKGNWIKESYLTYAPFEDVFSTWLHELSHKVGGDESEIFSNQLIEVQEMVLDILINNEAARQKMTALKEMYDNIEIKNIPINKEGYKAHLLHIINNSDYSIGNYEEKQNSTIENYEKEFDFQHNPVNALDIKPLKTLPDTDEYMKKLHQNGSVCVSIPNEGKAKPNKDENAIINSDDIQRLGIEESADITIKYGAKINWSNEKIARDILQNFYDGNGYTLEGVDIEVEKTNNGKYKIKIKGLGEYDYEHIENIGSSTKDNDVNSAGFYGEGTGIVAVNLLSKLDTPYVRYASGDWEVTFKRSSDNIKEALMTQTLDKNKERIEGNYIEFETENENLVESIIKSKDYFYHPYNPDFQNLDFENEFFGFKLCPNENGNLYYIQRYQDETGKMEKPLRNMGIVFKKAIINEPVGTGRDRTEIESDMLFTLAYDYATTMTDDELVKAICLLLPVYTNDYADSYIFKEPDSVMYFVQGLTQEAIDRQIKINFDNQKIVANTKKPYQDSSVSNCLHNSKYIFAPYFMARIGMKRDDEIYKTLHLKKSITPTEIEKKKLKILKEALFFICPQAEDMDIYMYESKNYFENFTSLQDEAGVMIDREFMEENDFIKVLSGLLAQVHDKNNNKELSTFSYDLTDQITDDLKVLIQNPEIAQKLKVIEEVYNEIETKQNQEWKYRTF